MKEPMISKQAHHVGPDRHLPLARLNPNRLPRRRPSRSKSQKKSIYSTLGTMSLWQRLHQWPRDHRISWEVMVRHTTACIEENELTVFPDDFDDFQSAPAPTPAAKPTAAPATSNANANLFDLLNSGNTSKPAVPPAAPAPSQRPPSYGNMMPSMAPAPVSRPSYTSPPVASTPSALSPKPTGTSSKSTFDDLFVSSLTSMGGSTNGGQKPGPKSMKDLEKEKAMNSLWGPSAGAQSSKPAGQAAPAKPSGGGGFDDLLM